MAKAVGLASGVLALATVTLKSTAKLFELVKSFQHHPTRVQELSDELASLQDILASLSETIGNLADVDFSSLKLPLQRCGNAVADFERELLKCSVHAGKDRTSFRDWAKLRYMGEDLDGFRRLLATYKATINIALTDATLRRSSTTAENVKDYHNLIDTARADLEDRLEGMDDKLERILGKNVVISERESQEVEMIKQERLSTEKCLQICADLSDHITQIELTSRRTSASTDSAITDPIPDQITRGGLQNCRESLANTARRLQGYEEKLFASLIDRSKTVIASDEDRADLARLRDEWEATRQSIDICDRASEHLRDNVSTIDNYAIGDAVQFMVSTNGKTIHGTNRGLGWRTRQVGGHVGDEALKEIARSLSGLATDTQGQNIPPQQGDTSATRGEQRNHGPKTEFTTQYGKGFTLTS